MRRARFAVESFTLSALKFSSAREDEMVTGRGSVAADRLVTVAYEAGHYVGGRIRNVVAFYWLKPGSVAGVEALVQLCEQVSAGRTRPLSAIHVVRPDIGLPDAAVRQALGVAMKKYANVTSCLAVVTPGAGFWVSALQSAITGIRMLAPVGGSMLRFVAKPADLRGWFVDEHVARTGESLDDTCVIEAISELMALGDERSAGHKP